MKTETSHSSFDAVIVPGGGVREGGLLPPWVESRCDHALRIAAGAPIILLSAATLHKPPPADEGGFPWLECNAAAAYLVAQGADPARLWTESSSYDTIGNAFFCRVIHTEPRRLRKLAVVNSAFHMARTRAVFEWVFSLDPSHDLTFFETPDAGLSGDAIRARQQKEQAALDEVARLRERIRSVAALHHFLYTEHDAYRAGGTLRKRVSLDSSAAESY